jgi:hypothetical protein
MSETSAFLCVIINEHRTEVQSEHKAEQCKKRIIALGEDPSWAEEKRKLPHIAYVLYLNEDMQSSCPCPELQP